MTDFDDNNDFEPNDETRDAGAEIDFTPLDGPAPERAGFTRVMQREQRKRDGRRPLLDSKPEIGRTIISYIRDGMFPSEAAWCAGTNSESVRKWMKQGKKDYEARERQNIELGLDENAGEPTLFEKFYVGVKQALAESEIGSLRIIKGGGWMAHAWYLERRYPQAYGRQDRINLQHSGGLSSTSINIAKALEDDESREKLAEFASILVNATYRENVPDGVGDGDDAGEDDFSAAFGITE